LPQPGCSHLVQNADCFDAIARRDLPKKYVGADCVARMTRQTGDAARKLSARTVQMPKSCAFAGD
jgi:hypothetical protein